MASAGAVRFVGAWHTHPDRRARESEIDREGMADLVGVGGNTPYQTLLMILGASSVRWSAWLEKGEHPEVYVRLVTRIAE